jgi:hypothetical protein
MKETDNYSTTTSSGAQEGAFSAESHHLSLLLSAFSAIVKVHS